jgi:hypothetical protein
MNEGPESGTRFGHVNDRRQGGNNSFPLVHRAGSSSFATTEPKPTASAVGATMHAKASAGAGMVSFAPVRSGIVRIGIDMRQLASQPFETLHLRIVGGALVPNGAEMGRYERQP